MDYYMKKIDINKLKEYQINHNFNLDELAAIIGTTSRSIRRWYKGEHSPLPVYRERIKDIIKKKEL